MTDEQRSKEHPRSGVASEPVAAFDIDRNLQLEDLDRYRDLVELAVDAIFVGDTSGHFIVANRSAEQLTGYSREELLAMDVPQLFSVEELARAPLRYDLLKQGQVVQTERLLTRKDGSVVPVEMHSKMMPDGSYHAFLRDVSQRKQMEQALREAEEQQRALADATFEAIILTRQGICLSLNRNAEKLFGLTSEEAIGSQTLDRVVAEERERAKEKILSGYEHPYETILLRSDGSRFPAEVQGRMISYRGESIRVTAIRDLSDRNQAQRDQQALQRLESLGILAGGIAHDFNNLLMGLFGNLSLIKRRLEGEHPAFKFVERAEQSLHRATHLTRKLLTFAKGGAPVREQISLGELVEEVVTFDLSGSNVRPVFAHVDDLWTADVDKGQIQQVFSNLAINADQAMPNGGHLYIELQNFDNSFGDCTDLAAGKYIKVQVRDEGDGIDPRVQKFIFDPYFSTKQTGRGLGLASVYSIITRHKGVINVTSEPGRGTTFTFYLPAADSAVHEEPSVSASAAAADLSAKVLVMDDDDAVLDIVAEMLETMGCTVVTAKNGPEAVELFRQARLAGRPFDVVTLDLTVPGSGGGKETVKQLLSLDSQARVIVSSGYAEDPVMARYADHGFTAVIPKPYIFDQLHKVIADVLKTDG